MSNFKNKFIFIAIITLIMIINVPIISNATGSMSAKISKTTVNVGDTFTITASANSAAGTYSVTTNNSNATITSSGSGFLDSSSETWTLKASKAGTVTITVKATDLIDADDDSIEINYSKTFTVTIKEKTSNSNTSTSSNSSSSTTTTAPKFTSVNQTMYTTGEVNVRASYSTSSAVIKTVEKGTKVTRTGIGDNGWSKVTYNGQTAYISSSLLTATKPVIEENKVEKPKETNTTKNEENKNNENKIEETNNEINDNTTNEENIEKIDEKEDNTIIDQNEKLQLSKLEIAGVNFSEGFNPEIYSYTLQLNFLVDNLTITAEANKQDAQVEIIGNENFVVGENNVTILLNSADGKETLTYQITVVIPEEVATSPQNDIQFYLMCGVIIIAAIAFMIIITLIYKRKSKNNDINDFSEVKNEVVKENLEDTCENVKPKKEKVKGGKHSN